MVLKMMPNQWQNKRLILSASHATVDTICRTLCEMVSISLTLCIITIIFLY